MSEDAPPYQGVTGASASPGAVIRCCRCDQPLGQPCAEKAVAIVELPELKWAVVTEAGRTIAVCDSHEDADFIASKNAHHRARLERIETATESKK